MPVSRLLKFAWLLLIIALFALASTQWLSVQYLLDQRELTASFTGLKLWPLVSAVIAIHSLAWVLSFVLNRAGVWVATVLTFSVSVIAFLQLLTSLLNAFEAPITAEIGKASGIADNFTVESASPWPFVELVLLVLLVASSVSVTVFHRPTVRSSNKYERNQKSESSDVISIWDSQR